MADCTCRLVYGHIGPRLGPPNSAPRGRARDPLCPVHGVLRCDHCGETSSADGFLEVAQAGPVDSVQLQAGDRLRIECAKTAGVELPEQRFPRFTARAT